MVLSLLMEDGVTCRRRARQYCPGFCWSVAAAMRTTHADSVTARCVLLRPYKSAPAAAVPGVLPLQRQDAQTLIDVVEASGTKEPLKPQNVC